MSKTNLKEAVSESFSPSFDSGNYPRVLNAPVKVMEELATHDIATYIKDMLPVTGVSIDEWYFSSYISTGNCSINNRRIAQILVDYDLQRIFATETATVSMQKIMLNYLKCKEQFPDVTEIREVNLPTDQFPPPFY